MLPAQRAGVIVDGLFAARAFGAGVLDAIVGGRGPIRIPAPFAVCPRRRRGRGSVLTNGRRTPAGRFRGSVRAAGAARSCACRVRRHSAPRCSRSRAFAWAAGGCARGAARRPGVADRRGDPDVRCAGTLAASMRRASGARGRPLDELRGRGGPGRRRAPFGPGGGVPDPRPVWVVRCQGRQRRPQPPRPRVPCPGCRSTWAAGALVATADIAGESRERGCAGPGAFVRIVPSSPWPRC